MSNWQRSRGHAAPSQAVTWKLLGLSPDQRVCSVCGKRMKLDDLRQYHITPGEPMRLACKECGPLA